MQTEPPDADLTEAIRNALRGEQISASDLRRPTLGDRPPRARHATRILAAVTAAVAVAAIAVGVSVVVSGRHDNGSAPAGSALAGVIGYRWDVTQAQDGKGRLPVRASLGAEIGFTRDGYLLGNDGLNGFQARYRTTSDGYRVDHAEDTIVGAVGSTNADPTRERITTAVDAMFSAIADSPDKTPPPVSVVARLSGTVLTLRRDAFTLTLTQAGTQPDFFAATPSATATPTGIATPTSEAAGLGTITGRLRAVGGPPDVPANLPVRGLPGTVTVTDTATRAQHSTPAAKDGRFSITVPYGTYELEGRSPRYIIDGANGTEGVCAAQRQVHLSTQATAHVDVLCSER